MKTKIAEITCIASIIIGALLGLIIGLLIFKSIYGFETGQKTDAFGLVILLTIMIVPMCISIVLGGIIWLKVSCLYIPKDLVVMVYHKIGNTNLLGPKIYKLNVKFLNWIIGGNNHL